MRNDLSWIIYFLIILSTVLILNLYVISFSRCIIFVPKFITTASLNKENEDYVDEKSTSFCDYSKGKWTKTTIDPLYNGSCEVIKESQNCLKNGRVDREYLYWRWVPDSCDLPKFDPIYSLNVLSNKHLAFVGDSLAWNQLESMICMLSSFYMPKLLQKEGEGLRRYLLKRWHFGSHFNVTISGYWSPFLVKGVERNASFPYSKIHINYLDEDWVKDLETFDVLLLNTGRWFLLPAIYFMGEGEEGVVGCHSCASLHYSEIEVSHLFRKILKHVLSMVIETVKQRTERKYHVIVNSFSPQHYEGDWDNNGTCYSKQPYEDYNIDLDVIDKIMKEAGMDELEKAIAKASKIKNLRLEIFDISKMALMRRDAHPGPYLKPSPFSDSNKKNVPNDCTHWCLPGAMDTWNEIMVQMINRRTND